MTSSNLSIKQVQQSTLVNAINWLIKFQGIILGLLIFGVMTSFTIVWPTNILWLIGGTGNDPAQHWLGWQFFRHSPILQWPLGANPLLGVNNSIVYTDSIPLLALFFKFFNIWLPKYFQYHGFLLLSCFILQGYFSQKILSLITQEKLLQTFGILFFLLSPVFLHRLNGHYQLMSHWVILLGIYFYFKKEFYSKSWLALILYTATTGTYLCLMVLGLWAADLIQKYCFYRIKPKFIIKHILLAFSLIIFSMWTVGYFMNSSGARCCYSIFGMNLISLFLPTDKTRNFDFSQNLLAPDTIYRQGNEGFNFLGLGILILLVTSVIIYIKNRQEINKLITLKWLPLFLLAIGLFIFSLSNNIAFGTHLLLHYEPFYPLSILTDTFRSAGRFFWPVYYLIYFVIFYVIFSYCRKQTAILLCGICLLIQVVDSTPQLIAYHNKFTHPPAVSKTLPNPRWKTLGKQYQHLIYTTVGGPRHQKWFELTYFAMQHGMSANSTYFGVHGKTSSKQENQRLLNLIKNNNYNPHSLYVFTNLNYWQFAQRKNPKGEFMVLNGIPLFAPGAH